VPRYRVSYFRTTTERVQKVISADPDLDDAAYLRLALAAEEDDLTVVTEMDCDVEFDEVEEI
jgi:hypothetical protein